MRAAAGKTVRRVPVPSWRLVACGAVIAAIVALTALVPPLVTVWLAAALVLGLLAAIDIALRPRAGSVEVRRRLPARSFVGRASSYTLVLRNASGRRLETELRERPAPEIECTGLSLRCRLEPGEEIEREIPFVGLGRGEHRLPDPCLRLSHPFGLLEYQETVPLGDAIAVRPGRPSGETEWLLARAATIEETGDRPVRRRGADREFDSLREYVTGDEIRRVDWKASARRHRPIVRQYRLERNAEVILALDCGRLMGSLVGGIPKLDLAMTPLLDLAAVALGRKERVGFLAFDSSPRAFLPPRPGLSHLEPLLAALASLPAGDEPTSYLRAVRYLESRHRKRSLVLVFTDFTDELTAGEMEATLTALTRRHVMVFVGVSDTHIEEILESPREDAASLFERAVAANLLLERRRVIARMESRGVHAVDADPLRLSAPVIRKYLQVRLGGAL